MATYKEIHGVKVQYRESDATAIEGDVWYNASTGLLKMYAALGSWASGGNLNQARFNAMGSGISNSSALCFGGKQPSLSPRDLVLNESYDGSSWTEIADMNAGKQDGGGFGTQTSAVCLSGYPIPGASCETWDGSSWTEVNNNNTARGTFGKSGTSSTVGIIFGGGNPGNEYLGIAETWDGTNWAEVADLTTGRSQNAGAAQGTSTATLCFGGETPPYTGITESWNGTSWTEVADLNTARSNLSGAGTSTAALAFSGYTTDVRGETEEWDGSSWTEVADLGTAITGTASTGTSSSAINMTGQTPPGATYVATSEEWDMAASKQTVAFD